MRGRWRLQQHRNRVRDRWPKIRTNMQGLLRTGELRTPAFFISTAKQVTNTTSRPKRVLVRPSLRRPDLLFRGVTSMEWLSYGVTRRPTGSFGNGSGVTVWSSPESEPLTLRLGRRWRIK